MAPDVCWNAPFKSALQRSYDDWMATDREYTAGGNPRQPPHEEYLQWIFDAWEYISKDSIAASFKVCGIVNASDGSEDNLIHCLKPEASIPFGQDLLQKTRNERDVLAEYMEELDLEEDFNNGYESEIDIEIDV